MVTVAVQLEEHIAERLPQLAESQHRTPEELVVEAVARLTGASTRPMPKAVGEYRGGQSDGSQNTRKILRDAVRASSGRSL